jgi:hypothetical protein
MCYDHETLKLEKFDKIPYFSYISRYCQSYIKDCMRIAPQHKQPIVDLLGFMCWSSFVDCNILISMAKGLRTPYKDALLQLGEHFL